MYFDVDVWNDKHILLDEKRKKESWKWIFYGQQGLHIFGLGRNSTHNFPNTIFRGEVVLNNREDD